MCNCTHGDRQRNDWTPLIMSMYTLYVQRAHWYPFRKVSFIYQSTFTPSVYEGLHHFPSNGHFLNESTNMGDHSTCPILPLSAISGCVLVFYRDGIFVYPVYVSSDLPPE
ncbi:hypothetical protein FKM82_026117 [Ascaphus truei]